MCLEYPAVQKQWSLDYLTAYISKKTNKNIVRISALKAFIAILGLPGSFLGLSGDLVSNIKNKEAYRNPKKLPGSPKLAIKTFRAEFLTMAL